MFSSAPLPISSSETSAKSLSAKFDPRSFSLLPRRRVVRQLGSFFALTVIVGAITTISVAGDFAGPAPLRVKGSFVIAAICKDGIIVASDSRGMLKDRQGRRLAYYDTNQKIFPIGDKLIADTGYASLNDPNISFLAALMLRFANNAFSRVEVDQLPNSYFSFATSLLPSVGAESPRLQTLVFAGFTQNKPKLCIYHGESGRTLGCSSAGYVSSPKQQIVGLQNVQTMSFAEAAKVMRKTIDDYAAAVQPGLVGGPVVIRTITHSGSQWFGSHPDWPTWSSFTDLADDYKANHVSFQLMPGVIKTQLDALIREGDAWARAGQVASFPRASGSAPVIDSSLTQP
jgi:20S proteasome alpha/beta subunit